MEDKTDSSKVVLISGDIPEHLEHLVTYWIGILVGLKIPYKIDPKSRLYRCLAEFRKEKWGEIQREKERLIAEGNRNFVVISGIDKESVKVNVEDVRYI